MRIVNRHNENSKDQKEKSDRLRNIIGLIIFCIIFGYFFLPYIPAYFVYQEQLKREKSALEFGTSIQSALKLYKEKDILHQYPEKISELKTLYSILKTVDAIVNEHPAREYIEVSTYESKEKRTHFKLVLIVYVRENGKKYLTITPERVSFHIDEP